MATTTWYVSKDASTADNGTSLGVGKSDYLPVGNYAGYDYRSFLGFSYSFSGMVTITSAILHMKTTGQVKVAFGADPDLVLNRITESWSEGTATTLSSTNAIERSNEPAVDATDVTWDVTTSENTWDTVDITTLINEAFSAGVFYGIRLIAADSGTDEVTEFYAREYGSNDAYIVVTYTTNTLPSSPTLNTPASVAQAQSLTPTFTFTHNDAESDACASYDIQVSTDNTFASVTHWTGSNLTSGITGDNISVVYAGSALSNGTLYYWRARTNDGTGDGAWTGARSFRTAYTPTATLTTPSSSGVFAKLTKGTPSWAAPRINVGWTFSCPDAGTQSSYQVVITQSSTGAGGTYSAFEDSGTVSSSSTSFVSDATVTNGYHYKVKVRVTCSHGQTSSYTSEYIAKTVWAVALHRFDCTSAPTAWSIGSIGTTVPTNASVVLEYGSNTTTSTPATFYSSVSSLTLARYFFYRVYLLPPYNSASVTFPSLDNLSLTRTSVALSPDHWTRSDTTNQTIDTSARKPGSNSLKLAGTGSVHGVYQIVEVEPNTDYVLSAWMKCLAPTDSSAMLAISSSSPTGAYTSTGTDTGSAEPFDGSVDQDWTHARTTVWNSGQKTSVYIVCRMGGASGTYVWFDDVKLEAATVATPFTPGSHQATAVFDGGGMQVDSSEGGIFRLKDDNGETVALGDGFEFSDAFPLSWNSNEFQLERSSANTLRLNDARLRVQRDATTDNAVESLVTGDANLRWIVDADGDMSWSNGTDASDTDLGRLGVGILGTSSHFTIGQRLRFTGVITPTALSANVNDWAPTGHDTASVIRVTSDATPRTITGISAGADGDILILVNANSSTAVTLSHNSGSSASGNRLLLPGAANHSLLARTAMTFFYDTTTNAWQSITAGV